MTAMQHAPQKSSLPRRDAAPPANAPPAPLVRSLASAATACGLTCVLMSLIFQPLNFWPLAFVCLVPWGASVCAATRAWVAYWSTYLAGFFFFLANLAWLWPVTDIGYVALCAYLAVYWPLAAWAVRTARRHGISAVWTLPVAWVACEYLRAWVMSGFPWLFLAHAFHAQTLLIQISDLTGAYGVTFLAALVNGVLIEVVLTRRRLAGTPALPRQAVAGAAVAVVLFAAALGYGWQRMLPAGALPEGPLVAVIQHDFELRNTPPYGARRQQVFAEYFALAGEAVARERPELVVFPETAWAAYQNVGFLDTPLQAADDTEAAAYAFGKKTHEATAAFARGDYARVNRTISEWERKFVELAQRGGDPDQAPVPTRLARLPESGAAPATVVTGSMSLDLSVEPTGTNRRKYNSALVYDPDGAQRAERYDKIHLVPFGETVPFRRQRVWGINLHPLYIWLNGLSPFSDGGKVEYSLWPGRSFTVFELDAGDRRYRFGTPICYEDVMPYLVQRYVWDGPRRRVDFLLNISNDGWFLHSAELPQHLAICVFRAVENRVFIARAVNTGISGFIDSDGRILETVGVGKVGYAVRRAQIDARASVYGRWGDVFAGACLALTALAWASGMFTRWVLGVRHWVARRRPGRE